jgi:hypothetical protein
MPFYAIYCIYILFKKATMKWKRGSKRVKTAQLLKNKICESVAMNYSLKFALLPKPVATGLNKETHKNA